MAEWKKYKLGEISETIFSGGTPSTTNSDYWNGDLNWLSSGETNNKFIIKTIKKITELGVRESSTRLAKKGNVVIASAGQGYTRGQVSYCLIDTYINQSLISIRVNEKSINSKFLFYNLNNRYEELRQISDSSSSRGSLTTKDFKELNILIPNIETQKEIASILSSLDEKIEINQQMNETLEAIAQTIFKEWFVDFEFPESPLTPLYQRGGSGGSEAGVGSGKRELIDQKNESFFDEEELRERGLISDGGYLPYNPKLKERARELRNNMTLSEKKLWKGFLQGSEYNWLRQKPLDHYIVDFYCPAFKLVIEVDGSHHFTEEGLTYDKVRTDILSIYGLKVIRFTNNEVLKEFEAVCEKINSVINEIKLSSTNQPEITNQQNPSSTTSALTPPFVKGGQGGFKSSGGKFVNGLPRGWGMGKLGDIAIIIDCLHSKKPEKVDHNTGFILLQLSNIIDKGLLDLSEKFYISESDYKKWISRIEISENDCIITNVGRVGAVAKIPKGVKAALGRNMTGIKLKKDYPFPAFLIQLLTSDFMKNEIEQKKDNGTILDALNVKNIPLLRFINPGNDVLEYFENIVYPIRLKMEENIKEI